MATILNFRSPAAGQTKSSRSMAGDMTAELIFFPGVRYERHAEAEPKRIGAKARPRLRARDKIELVDAAE